MNQGAFCIDHNFLEVAPVLAACRQIEGTEWRPVHESGEYADEKWVSIYVIDDSKKTEYYDRFPIVDDVAKRFKCKIQRMMFYLLYPGGILHPHRDMTGAVGLNGLRFHMPIQTNAKVCFEVSGRRVPMKPGELWALDTSFLHAVRNEGDQPRIHLILEVEVNDWVLEQLPRRDHRYYLHQANLIRLGVQKVAVMAVRERHRLRSRIPVVKQVFERLVVEPFRRLRR